MTIISTILGITAYGVVEFRRNIEVNNATKELMLQLRKARRYAINNVVTSQETQPVGYYIELVRSSGDYQFGEIYNFGGSYNYAIDQSVKSAQYAGIEVSNCICTQSYCRVNYPRGFSVIRFNAVTGAFVFSTSAWNARNASTPTRYDCEITVKSGSAERKILVSGSERTISVSY